MVYLKDIANLCGVSLATVSKALNNQPDISLETRERICAVADELGYFAHSAVRSGGSSQTNNLGVLYVDQGGRGLTHEFFAALLDSFKNEVESRGYDITFIHNHSIGGKNMTYLQHCLYRRVDGVLMACADFQDGQVLEVVNSSLPVVTIDHVFNNRASVLSDNTGGVEQLVSFVASRGHRKIAFLSGEPTAVSENRRIGFFRGCEENDIHVQEKYLLKARFNDPEVSYAATKQLLQLLELPTCILYPDDYSLTGGIRALREAGLHVPDDISVVGYDGIQFSQIASPKITTFRQNTEMLGIEAAKKLIEQVEHPRTALLDRIIVPGRLLPGETVKDLAK